MGPTKAKLNIHVNVEHPNVDRGHVQDENNMENQHSKQRNVADENNMEPEDVEQGHVANEKNIMECKTNLNIHTNENNVRQLPVTKGVEPNPKGASNALEVECTLFGNFVDELNSFLAVGKHTNVVVLVHFGKVKSLQESNDVEYENFYISGDVGTDVVSYNCDDSNGKAKTAG
ncbi:hypothetical protein JHK86_006582 [Glycine max]|nr:hypothetical protein JHK86_006582 [Glycine max]